MSRWQVMKGRGGTVLSSAMPKMARARGVRLPREAGGMQLKGVVVAAYYYDAPEGTVAGQTAAQTKAIYCDVILYGKYKGKLPRVLVTTEISSMHEGDIWVPRAPRLTVSGDQLDDELQGINFEELDATHVLVGFIENDIKQPVMLRSIPHPRADLGGSIDTAATLGHRLRAVQADKEQRLWKHRGAYFGLDDKGNWIIDLTKAHDGEYLAGAAEKPPVEDGSVGNHKINLPKGSTVEVSIEGGATLKLEDKDGNAKLTLGDGAVKMAVADHLQTLYEQLKAKLDAFDTAYLAHTHLYIFGPTGPASAGTPPGSPVTAPPWDSNINSSKLSTPDT